MHHLCWGTNYGGYHPRRAEVHPWTETAVFVQWYPLTEKKKRFKKKLQIVIIHDSFDLCWIFLSSVVMRMATIVGEYTDLFVRRSTTFTSTFISLF